MDIVLYALLKNKIDSISPSPYSYKGSVETYDDLPTDATTGDMYSVRDTGKSYVWDGEAEEWNEVQSGGGTSDYEELANRPKYNGTVMSHSTDIPEVKTATWDAKADGIHEHTVSNITDFPEIKDAFLCTYGTTTFAEISEAIGHNKQPVCYYDGIRYDYVGVSNNYHCFTAILTDVARRLYVKGSTWGNANYTIYKKPSGGIPKSDLSTSVQTSLDLADSALQSHQDISGKIDKSAQSEKTSEMTNAVGIDSNGKLWAASSGSSGTSDFEQLDNRPKYNGTLMNGNTNIPEIPANLSDLATDSTHRLVTDAEKALWNAKSDFSGNYNDLANKPNIPIVPADVSAFTNDAGYQTADDVDTLIGTAVSGKINKPATEGLSGQILATNGDGSTYWKTESGGGEGGTTDFEELSNRPKYSGSTMTRSTNIPEVKTAAWDAKYDKPSGGIPKSDLSTSVQTSLGLADSALQSHQDISGKADASDLSDEVNRATAAEAAIAADVDNIEALIPSQATSANQLADKAFVNSTVGTNTSNYISNNGEPFTSLAQLQSYSGTVTNNDYAFVTGTDSIGNTYYDRYKATVSGGTVSWAKEYRLNNSAFTAAQWSAIESGITSALVTKLNNIETGAEKNVQSDWNQSDTTADDFIKNKPTIPTVPTKLSDLTDDSTHRTVTDTEKSTWNSKQNTISDLETIRSGATLGATAVQPEAGKGLFSGSYNDLTNKPTIPSTVTEATVSGWGFTKNTGTYSKPSGGIPKSDLATAVQTSLGKADTALQSFTETDPTVPSWAKQTSKPTYTASEVGLGNVGNFKAVSTVANQGLTNTEKSNARANIGAGTSNFSGSYSDLTNKPTIPTVPTALSAFTDDLGSSPTHTHSQYYLATNPNGYTDDTVANSKYSKPSGGIPKSDLATAVQSSLDKADSALQSHQDISGKADKGTNFTVTLTVAGWSNNEQNVNNSNFKMNGYAYIVTPARASKAAWIDAEISVADAVTTANYLKFYCESVPSSAITVNITRVVTT